MSIIDFILHFSPAGEGNAAWTMIKHSGPFGLGLFWGGLAAIPIALWIAFRRPSLAWSLMASMAPFILWVLYSQLVALRIFGYMSSPDMDTVALHVAVQLRVVLGGLSISLVLVLISVFARPRSESTSR